MSGARSRRKGAKAENDIAKILGARGVEVRRTPLSGGLDWKADLIDKPGSDTLARLGLHLEVKRQERLALPAWIAQSKRDAPDGFSACVVWRRNNEPWYIALPFDQFLDLIGLHEQEDEQQEQEDG